jgi:multidrug efflux pump subunit AcrA (membrane-fusion protein)
MILHDTLPAPGTRPALRVLVILGALSLPFLPRPAAGEPPAVAQASSQGPPAQAGAAPADQGKHPNVVTIIDEPKPDPQPDIPILEKVRVTQPVIREIVDYEDMPGQIVAARQVDLKARVSGAVVSVYCQPGQTVKKDERLFQIDERPYKAELNKAQAELERARARLMRPKSELANTKRLLAQKAVSQSEVERLEGELLEADAAVKVAQAASDSCALNLEFTQVTAPFAGTIGGPVLGLGNVAVADTTRLATIVSTDPVSVAFEVDQSTILRINRLRLLAAQSPRAAMRKTAEQGPGERQGPQRKEVEDERLKARIEGQLIADAQIVALSDRLTAARANLRQQADRVRQTHRNADPSLKRLQEEVKDLDAKLDKLRAPKVGDRITEELCRDPDLMTLAGEIANARDHLERAKSLIRSSADPAIVIAQKRIKKLQDQWNDLWNEKYPEIQKRLQAAKSGNDDGKVKDEPWTGPSVAVGLPDEDDFPRKGTIESMNISVDPNSGHASWRASVPNVDGLLVPGMSIRVRLVIRQAYKAPLVPMSALLDDGNSTCVFVVAGENILEKRRVRTEPGSYEGGLRLADGLKEAEWVVIHLDRVLSRARGPIEGQKVLMDVVPDGDAADKPRQ